MPEFGELREKGRIEFDRSLTRKDWPHEYENQFQVIFDITERKLEHYAADTDENRNLKRRCWRLIQVAQLCTNECVNEMTWRLRTESLVLERFDEPIAW